MSNEAPPRIQRVVCAAIRHARTGRILTGARHFDTVMQEWLKDYELGDWADADQGFIDQWGTFLTRQEAFVIAERQGQYNPWGEHTRGVLYSEDLY